VPKLPGEHAPDPVEVLDGGRAIEPVGRPDGRDVDLARAFARDGDRRIADSRTSMKDRIETAKATMTARPSRFRMKGIMVGLAHLSRSRRGRTERSG
jgi:hypothetical protein